MKKPQQPSFLENIVQSSMEDVLHNAMIPYAEHVILERALPRVEDGLKPVQRRILFTMRELANTPDKPHRKCARIVGDCLGKYHPHGDSSVYDALVRMAQPFSLRAPLVDGHGNFGSIDGDSAAAMRYTEARMTPLALQMLRDIDKDTVPFRLNFDDTQREPDMLPARFPNLLVNGASGIAVGLATNIPPHNFGESIDAVVAQMDNPDISLAELMKIIPAPDFPTGGVLLDNDEIRAGYETGRSKLTLRARVHVEDGAAGRKLLVITEVPYQVSKAAMLERILKLSEEKKAALGAIYDIRDESDRTGLRAVIELRREADPERVLAYLYKYSDMQVTFGVNIVAIADGKPEQMGLKKLIDYFIRYQKEVVTRRTRYDLDHAKARAHVLEGLMTAVDNLDEVIALIRASKTVKDARDGLMKRFALSEIQAQAILDLRLQRLTNLEILALRKEYNELLRLIAELEGILKSERKLLNLIRRELSEIRAEFADPRRTTLVSAALDNVPEITEARVAEEATVVFTRGGQLRRMHPKTWQKLYQQPAAGAEPLPPDAAARWTFQTDTDRTLYFFTNIGNCYTLSVGALAEMNRPRDRGTALAGVLAGLKKDETLAALYCMTDAELDAAPDFLFVTKLGTVKRTRASEYSVRRQKFAALNLRQGDAVLDVLPCPTDGTLLLVSDKGMCIRFPAAEVNAQGRVAGGVKGMQLVPNDFVIAASALLSGMEVLVVSERGSMKRVPEIDFEPQSRGGKGVRLIAFNKNGSTGTRVVAALVYMLAEGLNVRVTQAKSEPTVMPVTDVPVQGKQGKGVACVMAILDDVVTGAEGEMA